MLDMLIRLNSNIIYLVIHDDITPHRFKRQIGESHMAPRRVPDSLLLYGSELYSFVSVVKLLSRNTVNTGINPQTYPIPRRGLT